ncbi:MAG TPA: FAD-binding protein [Candidatus Anammoximicrobium sp.]|nr:FAD-binding protein [Candidatus Anammoximicrobium sp.]
MRILVVAEHDGRTVAAASRSALAFARQCATATDGRVEWLLLGHQLDTPAADAATYAPVLAADSPALIYPLAEPYAAVIVAAVTERRADLLVAANGTSARDIVTRAAGLLGGAMASDVVRHEFRDGRLRLQRPMYAAAVLATVELLGTPQIVTIQPTAYAPAERSSAAAEVTRLDVSERDPRGGSQYVGLAGQRAGRPDVNQARVVVSGGRAIQSREDFERVVGGLADALGGATGSTRPLVDAGIAPNECQVGQTGRIVAPELYVALGLSGSVQHLAGMKNAKTIVAINRDPEAPIFSATDHGLVGDIYEVVPELIARLRNA